MAYRRISRKRPIRRRPKRASRSRVPAATKKYVRKMMPKVEMKQVWAHQNEVQLSTLAQGNLLPFPLISAGASSEQRIGTSINAMSVHVKGTIFNNSGSESFVRQLLIGYAPTVDPTANLFRLGATNASAAITSVNGMDAMYYPINKTEIKVYHDRTYKLAGSATGVNGSNTVMFSKFIKFKGRKIEFKSTDATPDNWIYSLIHIAADANDDTSTGTNVELNNLLRFYYKDA